MSTGGPRKSRRATRLLIVYVALLVTSHVIRGVRTPPPAPPGIRTVQVAEVAGGERLDRQITIAYRDTGGPSPDAPAVILIHGSPGRGDDFSTVSPALDSRYRVIAPDLPGFRHSTAAISDYSVKAHAEYLLQLMEVLGVHDAHFVGFSMGAAVGLRAYELRPEAVRSLTLLAGLGVQELELLGDYHLNHLIHGTQLTGLWLLYEAVPHMGLLDGMLLDVPYARNFFDTDQRPLRRILAGFEPPMLILHGRDDFLVPPEAGLEHHRLVPQSELAMVDADHFLVFTRGPQVGGRIGDFLDAVESGRARSRSESDPERVRQANAPFDPTSLPPVTGMALALLFLVIILATLISEDLTCVVVGLLASQGRIELIPGIVACFVGIFLGDMLLFVAGRVFGRPLLRRAPFRWWLSESRVELASRWFARRGPFAIGLSRFLPGARLPTYFAAGMLRTSFWAFTIYFFLAVAIWTPVLVGGSSALGSEAMKHVEIFRQNTLLALTLVGLFIVVVLKVLIPLLSYPGRRRLAGAWCRIVRWEFWPAWLFYSPVAAWVALLAVRHRSPLLFTAANPGIPAGGVISESKSEILKGLGDSGLVARHLLLARGDVAGRLAAARSFMDQLNITFPVVLKPDRGQRGSGVAVIRDPSRMEAYLSRADCDVLIQEYAPGKEFGLFYCRMPGAPSGRIFSVTEKRLPFVVGDGHRNVQQLILADRRAVCLAQLYLRQQARQLTRVPESGERVALVELGTHCRGAIFLDGIGVLTEELEVAIDRLSCRFDGFYFGRYDVRAPEIAELMRGRGFKVIELNGVTSEATHIYDPRIGLAEAYRTLFRQWRLAYRIGARNRAAGCRVTSAAELVGMFLAYRRQSRHHERAARAAI